jgi:hypothetical protein
MKAWWDEVAPAAGELRPAALAARLLLAFALGLAVAAVHRLTARRSVEAPTLSVTLVLLSILIAMVTQVIGNSVALAFSLVGALSIVRFRTVVEDTRDTAFVIFAVVEGMAAGEGNLSVALIGLVVVGLAAFVVRPRAAPAVGSECTLIVRVGLKPGQESVFERRFEPYLERWSLISAITTRQGAALELTWQVRLKPDVSVLALVGELNQVEGVQSVEVQRR